MTKQELIERVAQTEGLPPEVTKKMVGLVVDAVFAELGRYFIKTRISRRSTPRFTFPGFGTFTKKLRAGRTGRNPHTGERIVIAPAVTIGFQPGQELRAYLNRNLLKSQG